jgi:ATP synthase protein I
LLVPEFDVMPLDLIPMLLGFFTYKAATLVETFMELLPSRDEKNVP